MKKGIVVGVLMLGMPTLALAADSLDLLRYAISGGAPSLDVRLRYESVDQGDKLPAPAAPLQKATVDTLRTRLGYTTGKWNDLDMQVEFEDVHALNDESHYNSCPAGIAPAFSSNCNGHTTKSVIADPTGTELNQFWLRYGGLPKTVLKYGRQKLILDNARFIGNVGWRQNEMTYDGFTGVNTWFPKVTATYAHLTNANNIFFGNFDLKGDLLNVAWAQSEQLNLVGYGYFMDFDKNTVVARPDNKVLGLRGNGAYPFDAWKFLYAWEYAKQKDYKDSTSTVDADYYLAEAGANLKALPLTAKLGYEVLSSNDGLYGFQTPLATLHAFQGWADQFLTTPKTGIKDAYLNLGYTVEKVVLTAVYHDYKADTGGLHYGDEINLMATRPINDNLSLTAKYADFNAKENDATSGIALRDTKKIWVQADYKF